MVPILCILFLVKLPGVTEMIRIIIQEIKCIRK